jgi:hypothetical protein
MVRDEQNNVDGKCPEWGARRGGAECPENEKKRERNSIKKREKTGRKRDN